MAHNIISNNIKIYWGRNLYTFTSDTAQTINFPTTFTQIVGISLNAEACNAGYYGGSVEIMSLTNSSVTYTAGAPNNKGVRYAIGMQNQYIDYVAFGY